MRFHIPAFKPPRNNFTLRLIRLILLCLLRGEKPILFFRFWLPFSKGNHVCFFFSCWRVEMFFSYYFIVLFLLLK